MSKRWPCPRYKEIPLISWVLCLSVQPLLCSLWHMEDICWLCDWLAVFCLAEPEAGEVSPPVGAGVNSNSWTFKYGPGNPKQSGPGELPDKFIIPGSPAIISIRQEPTNSQIDKSDFITFGKKEETKKKKKKKKGNKTQEKKEKGNSTTDNSDQWGHLMETSHLANFVIMVDLSHVATPYSFLLSTQTLSYRPQKSAESSLCLSRSHLTGFCLKSFAKSGVNSFSPLWLVCRT